MRRRVSCVITLLLLLLPACGAGGGEPAAALELRTSPEHVNRVIPGLRPIALVTAGDTTSDVELSATVSLAGGSVSLRPDRITAGGVAEVWMTVPDVTEEAPFTVTVTGRSGSASGSLDIAAVAVPGVDDLAATAGDIVAVFLAQLGGSVDGLPTSVADLGDGTPVAGLLVVSHYAWFSENYEVGLAWHIMVAPDDWAELTIRPRTTSLAPTAAYRLSSWSTALAGGEYDLTEVEPPAEVTR